MGGLLLGGVAPNRDRGLKSHMVRVESSDAATTLVESLSMAFTRVGKGPNVLIQLPLRNTEIHERHVQ